MIERDAPKPLRPRLAKARAIAESSVAGLRRVISALGPAVLDRLGLEAALRAVAEQQGLYAPAVAPRSWDAAGQAPPVDVYIEDRHPRGGAYDYTTLWDTQPPHILVSAVPNPPVDASPHRNTTSYVFVRVSNRGTDPNPPPATVRVFAARAPGAKPPRWRLAPGLPNRWVELTAPAPGAVTSAVVAPPAANRTRK